MFKFVFKTMDKNEADAAIREAYKKYGFWNVRTFQYRAKDGNFYYEILWETDEE